MKKLLLFALIVASMQLSAQQMLVGSYNIRYKNANDSINGEVWSKRCQVICDQVNFMAPDIFGTQEVLYSQLQDMVNALDGYGYIGVGRDDGLRGGEHEAIFYKKRKLRLLDNGDFWLSETPDKPGLGWDAVCVRICTWGKFAVKTEKEQRSGLLNRRKSDPQKEFYYFNLHMDHVGVVARREAAKLVVQRIREIAQGAPVFVTGDFNVDQNDEIYSIFTESGLLKDSYDAAASVLRRTVHSIPSRPITSPRVASIMCSFRQARRWKLMACSPTVTGHLMTTLTTISKPTMRHSRFHLTPTLGTILQTIILCS